MAIDATPTLVGSPRAALRLVRASDGIRDDAERVVLPTSDALEPWLEVVAIADDVLATAERLRMVGELYGIDVVVNESNRLSFRISNCRDEARERIEGIEPRNAA